MRLNVGIITVLLLSMSPNVPADPQAADVPPRMVSWPLTQPSTPPYYLHPSYRSLLKRPAEFPLDGVALDEALAFLRDAIGLNVVVDWAGLEATGVTADVPVQVNLHHAIVRDALAAILMAADEASHQRDHPPTVWDSVGGVVIIAPSDRIDRAFVQDEMLAVKAHDRKSQDMLARVFPGFRIRSMPLGEVLNFLKDTTGMAIDIDWGKVAGAGVTKDTPVSLELRDTSVARTLNLILFSVGATKMLDYWADNGRITVFVAETRRAAITARGG